MGLTSSATPENAPEADEQVQQKVKKGDSSELDLVFAMDCTSSMGSYIESAKKTIIKMVEKITASEKADVRFSYIAYRDWCDKKSTFLYKVHAFTSSPSKMREYVLAIGPEGGGDGPEAVEQALNQALKLPYRKNAVKIIVLILDAPPHGVSGSGDDHPNGDPEGLDCIKMARQMAAQGIILYVVACEPSLSGYANAHDFMAGLAQITEGRYLPLTSADLLPDVIIGGAQEEIALQKLEAEVAEESKKLKQENPKMKDEEIADKVSAMMDKKGVEFNELQVDDIYGAYDMSNVAAVSKCESLADARANMKALSQPALKVSQPQAAMSSSYASSMDMNECVDAAPVQNVSMKKSKMESHHVMKVMNRAMNKEGY
jgi:hypothetical protein